MGFGLSLFSVCGLIFLGIFLGLKTCLRLHPARFLLRQDEKAVQVFYLFFLLGGLILSLLLFMPISAFSVFALGGGAVLGIEFSSVSQKKKALLSFLLCLGIVPALYSFSELPVLGCILMTFIVWGGWRLFAWFDRFPLTSFMVSLTWMIALVSVGFVMNHVISDMLISMVALLGTEVIALMYFRLSQKQAFLGKISSSLVGFMWASIWGYFLTQGAISSTIVAWGYYLFEIVILVAAFVLHKPFQTFFAHFLEYPQYASKAVNIVFSHLLILSFLSVMTLRMSFVVAPVLFLGLIAILTDLYFRLNTLENPQPTWRELLKDTKMGINSFVGELKNRMNQAKDEPVSKTKKVVKKGSQKVVKKAPPKKRKKKAKK